MKWKLQRAVQWLRNDGCLHRVAAVGSHVIHTRKRKFLQFALSHQSWNSVLFYTSILIERLVFLCFSGNTWNLPLHVFELQQSRRCEKSSSRRKLCYRLNIYSEWYYDRQNCWISIQKTINNCISWNHDVLLLTNKCLKPFLIFHTFLLKEYA